MYHHLPLLEVKGRLQTSNYEKDGEIKYVTDVVSEKLTFLSDKKQE